MATVTRTHTFVDGETLPAANLNNEFNNLLNALAIVNADISSSAAIATTKINFGSVAQGGVLYDNGTNIVELVAGTSGQFLQTQGAGANPQWATPSTVNFATSGQQNPVFNTSSQTYVDVTNATLTINPTKTVTVHAICSGELYGTNLDDIFLALLIDGTIVHYVDVTNQGTNKPMSFSLNAQASVASGARIIKLQVYNNTAAHAVIVDRINISVIWG